MKIGEVELFLVHDGTTRTDGGGMFGLVPKVMWEKKYPADEQNRVVMRDRLPADQGWRARIVVDTGYGSNTMSHRLQRSWESPRRGSFQTTREHGVDPSEVDLVINTHLHFDHAGGNTVKNGDRFQPAFPNATYVMQRGEWDEANNPNERTRATYLPGEPPAHRRGWPAGTDRWRHPDHSPRSLPSDAGPHALPSERADRVGRPRGALRRRSRPSRSTWNGSPGSRPTTLR